MTMIATCGHEIRGFENQLSLMDIAVDHDSEGFVRIVSKGVYCEECARYLTSLGVVLLTPEEEDLYLSGKLEYPVLEN